MIKTEGGRCGGRRVHGNVAAACTQLQRFIESSKSAQNYMKTKPALTLISQHILTIQTIYKLFFLCRASSSTSSLLLPEIYVFKMLYNYAKFTYGEHILRKFLVNMASVCVAEKKFSIVL